MTPGPAALPGDPGTAGRRRATRLSVIAGVAFLALAALSSFLPGGGGQGGGSPSSSYSNRPDGTAAWAELLSRFGHHVERLRGDIDASLDPGTTVIVLDAPGLTGGEAAALGRFVRLGGRLVAGGAGAGHWLESVIDDPPTDDDRGARTAGPVGTPPAPEVDGVAAVRTAQLGSWRSPGSLEPILAGDQGRVIALAGDTERGRVVALADPSPVQNALLAADDNAALALGLAGGAGRPVLFAEGAHGYGQGEGLAALPRRWRLTLAGFGLAAATWLLARSRRLGPPEDEARPLPPPRWAYVDAVAGTLARTRRAHEAVEPVRHRARELIARRAGLGPDAGTDDLYQAALRLGLAEDEAAAALGGGPVDDTGILAAGRALARLTGGER
ncbi:MAG TPA: DUF4350 domain-containing protein [Acidimicrobiia bacterium]|nr:DUF4350 domain-containing protein [Acidimicrobiia bacterium]